MNYDTTEVAQYVDYVYGNAKGYAYCPLKDPNTGKWTKEFFYWPTERKELIEHVESKSRTYEVYISPSLYKAKSTDRESWLGTNVVWADFDYGTPKTSNKGSANEKERGSSKATIPPSLRIRSSIEGHEHWYWKLPFFETNIAAVESLTKRIAYSLGADLSGWDYYQTLRPPGSIHHKTKQQVTLLSLNGSGPVPIEAFAELKEVPQENIELDISSVPNTYDVIAKYAFPQETFKQFKQRLTQVDDRSNELCVLAYNCAELGLADEEILSLLFHADNRWEKFKDRSEKDRLKCLSGILKRARLKYPRQLHSGEVFPTFGLDEFLSMEIELEWIVEQLVHRQGFVVLSSPPEVGKTQFSLQTAIHIALGKEFVGFKVEKPYRVLFISMEMGHADLHFILRQMARDFSGPDKKILQENCLVVPLGYSVLLDKKDNQEQILKLVDKYQPQGIFLDSLGVAVGDNIKDDSVINQTFDFLNRELRINRDMFLWLIHHNRKDQVGNRRPKRLSDLYGSQYIGAHATTVVGLWSSKPKDPIEVNCLKMRMASHFDSFIVERTDNLNFDRIERPVSEEKEEKEIKREQRRSAFPI